MADTSSNRTVIRPRARPSGGGHSRARLHDVSGGVVHSLRSGTLGIGRDRSCDLFINDGSVSRRHASIEVQGDTDVEPEEGFTVFLSNPENARISQREATGTIQNDEESDGIFGTENADTITPLEVSEGVTGGKPSDNDDTINALGGRDTVDAGGGNQHFTKQAGVPVSPALGKSADTAHFPQSRPILVMNNDVCLSFFGKAVHRSWHGRTPLLEC